MNKIHTTIGVYLNGDYKINGVKEEDLDHHIKYNILWRFGRALIVDGKIVFCGYWKEKDLLAYMKKKRISQIKRTKCTAPYK